MRPAVAMLQMLTANRLAPGEVVYWNERLGWVPRFADAAVMSAPQAAEALEGAADWVAKREVVAPYLFEVRIEEGIAVPVKIREAIRAAGPTMRPDLGKQAL